MTDNRTFWTCGLVAKIFGTAGSLKDNGWTMNLMWKKQGQKSFFLVFKYEMFSMGSCVEAQVLSWQSYFVSRNFRSWGLAKESRSLRSASVLSGLPCSCLLFDFSLFLSLRSCRSHIKMGNTHPVWWCSDFEVFECWWVKGSCGKMWDCKRDCWVKPA